MSMLYGRWTPPASTLVEMKRSTAPTTWALAVMALINRGRLDGCDPAGIVKIHDNGAEPARKTYESALFE